MSLASMHKEGEVLDGRFLLREPIAQGGMATVFKAEDLHNRCAVVVAKVLLPAFSSGLGSWSMFQREEEIGLRLHHPYVLKFVALPADKRRTYLITEYVAGPTLADRLRHGLLGEAQALSIASRLCEAVDYVHRQGFVHYDVKPANVILCPDGGLRLIDFGLAHEEATRYGSWLAASPAIASSGYAAPEQIRRRRGRKSADIYALGATLYEMLTGRPPFAGDDPFVVASARTIGDPVAPSALNSSISPEVEEIVLRALRRKPEERYSSAAAMKTDLDRPQAVAVSGLSARLRPVTRWRRYLRLARYATFVAALPILFHAALFALLWWHFAGRR